MKARLLLSATVVGLASVASFPEVASASSTSGTEHIQITTTNNNPGAVLARGVFTASGIDYPKSGDTDLFVFPTGAFTVHHPGGSAKFSLNPKTCLLRFNFAGSYTLKSGVGDYRGISGSGTYKGVETGVLPRKPNGTCNESKHAQPFSSVSHISASGPLSFTP
jgi:hypothetical protein